METGDKMHPQEILLVTTGDHLTNAGKALYMEVAGRADSKVYNEALDAQLARQRRALGSAK